MNGDHGSPCFHNGLDISTDADVVLNMEGIEETALGKQSDTSYLSPNTFTNTNIQVGNIVICSRMLTGLQCLFAHLFVNNSNSIQHVTVIYRVMLLKYDMVHLFLCQLHIKIVSCTLC